MTPRSEINHQDMLAEKWSQNCHFWLYYIASRFTLLCLYQLCRAWLHSLFTLQIIPAIKAPLASPAKHLFCHYPSLLKMIVSGRTTWLGCLYHHFFSLRLVFYIKKYPQCCKKCLLMNETCFLLWQSMRPFHVGLTPPLFPQISQIIEMLYLISCW